MVVDNIVPRMSAEFRFKILIFKKVLDKTSQKVRFRKIQISREFERVRSLMFTRCVKLGWGHNILERHLSNSTHNKMG